LAVAKGLFRGDIVLASDGIAILDLPILAPLPLRKVLAVEEDNGIGGRAAVRARIYDLGLGPDDPALVFLVLKCRHRSPAGRGCDETADDQPAGRGALGSHGECSREWVIAGRGGWRGLGDSSQSPKGAQDRVEPQRPEKKKKHLRNPGSQERSFDLLCFLASWVP
jgi:hypothetical protein